MEKKITEWAYGPSNEDFGFDNRVVPASIMKEFIGTDDLSLIESLDWIDIETVPAGSMVRRTHFEDTLEWGGDYYSADIDR